MNILAIPTALALALAPTATAPTPAPEDGQQVVVVAESTSNVVLDGTTGSANRLATPHEGDIFNLVSENPVDGSYMRFYEVILDDGITHGFVPMSTVVIVPDVTLGDLTSECVIVAPSVDGSWLGNLASGSNTAYAYPTSASTKIGQPNTGTVLDCADDEVVGSAGIAGQVSFSPVEVNDSLAYVRSEYVATYVPLDDLEMVGTATAAEDTPVYEFPSATDDDTPIAGIPAGTKVKVGTPSRGFTPVEHEGARGWAPTSVLNGIESWQSKSKDKLSEWWGATKEKASEVSDKVKDKYADAKDKIDEKTDNGGGFFAGIRDTPAMVGSILLALATLTLAWVRRLGVLPLPRIARRAFNVAAIIPLLILASIAPIGSYAWLLWVVLGVTGAVAAGVLSGFRPTLSRAPEIMRNRRAQIIAASVLVGGALLGAIVTGFAGWLAPLAAAVVSFSGALGYLLSAPVEKPVEEDETSAAPERPATPAASEPTPAVVELPVADEKGAIR